MYSHLSLSFAVLTGERVPLIKIYLREFARATSLHNIK